MKKTASLTVLALAATAASTFAAASWPAYRGPSGDGTTDEKLAGTLWRGKGPKVVWKAPTPAGFSSFSVADGKAFTIVSRDVDGVPSEVAIALDAATGKEAWAFPLKPVKYDGGGDSGAQGNGGGDGPRSTPTVANGKVYVMGGALNLACIDAATGKAVWEKDIVKDFGGKNIQWQNAASPLVEDGVVFVAGGGNGQALIALKADSGETVWKAEDDKMTHATPVAATIHGTRQIVFFTQKGLVSTDPKSGKVLWRYAFPYRISTAASPIVSGDLVYCSAGYGVGAGCARIAREGDGFTATELWRKEGEQVANHWSTPICKDGYLYGMFSFKKYGSGPVCCVELKTGEIKWSEAGFGPGNLILTGGDTLLALSDKGELVAIAAQPDKYKELARAKVVDGKCWSTPVLAGGRIYARSTKEAVCLDPSK